MKPVDSAGTRSPLPARAKAVFALALVLVCVSLYVRLPGKKLETWQKLLFDGPMLVMVAFSSLVWATYRHMDQEQERPNDQEYTPDESP